MAYPDPVMTSARPRLVILKGDVSLDAGQLQSLRVVFDVVEVHSAAAARKMLDGSSGGMVVCGAGRLSGEGEGAIAASSILERVGEGVGVVDAAGGLAWTDARFKVHDEHTRSEFIRLCRQCLEQFNEPVTPGDAVQAGARRRCKRLAFASSSAYYEVFVCPASAERGLDRVTSVVGVLWEVTPSQLAQAKSVAIDQAGADLLRIESATISGMNMAERLKLLEAKIVRTVREVLGFDNFEVRLLDRESNRLELVIAENIAPLKIGEVLHANAEGNGISGFVAATGKSYLCPQVQGDAHYREGLEGAQSALTVPLLLHERVIGTFNAESARPAAFTEADVRCAEAFGRYIAAAMNILDLLVVERYTTSEQLGENVLNELSGPIEDLTRQARKLRETDNLAAAARSGVDQMLHTITRLRERLDACAAGPRTILGAEQEMHRHDRDPLIAGRRILVADDEPAIRDTLRSLLMQKGADVTVCATGAETIDALERTRLSGAHYDMVLSDIKMPDRNGYEVYRTAKAINPATPVILMTGFGYDPHHCIVRASQEGLQSFLFKPFKASQLMDVLVKMLGARAA